MTFRFTKMHGTGNDYVYVNGFEQEIENPGELSIRISDRHFGIGSDGHGNAGLLTFPLHINT